MLQDKFMFKIDYAEVLILIAHLKAIQVRAVIEPHNRKEGKSLELLLCDILKSFSRRLEVKTMDYQTNVKFFVKRNEALAFHCAYKYKWIQYQIAAQTIFETIDKKI